MLTLRAQVACSRYEKAGIPKSEEIISNSLLCHIMFPPLFWLLLLV